MTRWSKESHSKQTTRVIQVKKKENRKQKRMLLKHSLTFSQSTEESLNMNRIRLMLSHDCQRLAMSTKAALNTSSLTKLRSWSQTKPNSTRLMTFRKNCSSLWLQDLDQWCGNSKVVNKLSISTATTVDVLTDSLTSSNLAKVEKWFTFKNVRKQTPTYTCSVLMLENTLEWASFTMVSLTTHQKHTTSWRE